MSNQLPLKYNGLELEVFQSGDTIPVTAGGTGADNATDAKINLGLEVGADIQEHNPKLDALSNVSTNGYIVYTGSNTFASRTITTADNARLTVTNGDGLSGNTVIDLATLVNSGSGSFVKISTDNFGRITGTEVVTASDIRSLTDTVYLLQSGGTLTGYLTLNADPSNPLHAVTKQYADAIASGIHYKESVKAATTTDIVLSGLQNIDGIGLAVSDRVLVKNQNNETENGIYVAASGSWSRATDADTGAKLKGGTTVWVNEGAVFGDTSWTCITDGDVTIGISDINWTQNGASDITAGDGLTKTGNTISVGTASSSRIVVNSSNIDLAASGITPGTYTKVTFDSFGRATVGANATPDDIGAQPESLILTSIDELVDNGFLVKQGNNVHARTITGTAGKISVSNGDGVSGNPTINLVPTGVTPGTYNSVTVDADGRVTNASNEAGSAIKAVNDESGIITIGSPVYASGNDLVKLARANNASTKNVIGFVYGANINSSAEGDIVVAGPITATTTQWDSITGDTGGLVAGSKYFLSNSTAGGLSTSAPVTGYVAPVGKAVSATTLIINIEPTIKL